MRNKKTTKRVKAPTAKGRRVIPKYGDNTNAHGWKKRTVKKVPIVNLLGWRGM